MNLTPEEARALLSVVRPEETVTAADADEDAALHIIAQLKIIDDPTDNGRGMRLAELHAECITHPENTAAHEEQLRLLKEIEREARAELQIRKKEVAAGT